MAKILDFIKWKPTNKKLEHAKTVKYGTPSFSNFGENVMSDETVATITNRILDEFSKLEPRHIRTVDGKQVAPADNNINNLFRRPNSKMTLSDFLRRCAWLRTSTYNCFIYPTYDLYINNKTGQRKKVYTGLYPLQVSKYDFYEDTSGKIYIKFTFPNGTESPYLAYDEVIHWRKNYGEDEYKTAPNNTALLKQLKHNHKMNEAAFKSVESSLSINGIIKIGTLLEESKREEYRQTFEQNLMASGYGIAAMDNSAEYTHIPFNGLSVQTDMLKFLESKSRRHYGVSEAILDGDYTSEQKEAFYETVLEEGINSLGQAFTRVLLTPFEESNGNKIVFYSDKISLMSADKKLRLAELLLPVGGLTLNEVRSWFGLEEKEGLDDLMMSLNYIKKDIADKYQVGSNVITENDEDKSI